MTPLAEWRPAPPGWEVPWEELRRRHDWLRALSGCPQDPRFHAEGDVDLHTRLACRALTDSSAFRSLAVDARDVVFTAALMHDVGKPPTWQQGPDRIRFHGHDTLSARMAEQILVRLRAPRELREAVVEISREHIRFASLPAMRPRRREQWLRSPRFPLHLAFHRADCLGSHGNLSIYETAAAALAALPPERTVLVTGADALALGVPEGPLVGELLRAVERQLDADAEREPTRAQALAALRQLAAPHVKPGT